MHGNVNGIHHFVEQPDSTFECSKCGEVTAKYYGGPCPADQVPGAAKCSIRTGDVAKTCAHNQGLARIEVCASCKKGTKVKVFKCAVRGECQLSLRLHGLMTCMRCPDFEGSDAAVDTKLARG